MHLQTAADMARSLLIAVALALLVAKWLADV